MIFFNIWGRFFGQNRSRNFRRTIPKNINVRGENVPNVEKVSPETLKNVLCIDLLKLLLRSERRNGAPGTVKHRRSSLHMGWRRFLAFPIFLSRIFKIAPISPMSRIPPTYPPEQTACSSEPLRKKSATDN